MDDATYGSSRTHHYYPLAKESLTECLVSSSDQHMEKHKESASYIRCPVTFRQMTFGVWKMIGHHCGDGENLAALKLAARRRGGYTPPPPLQLKCSRQRLWNRSCLCVELFDHLVAHTHNIQSQASPIHYDSSNLKYTINSTFSATQNWYKKGD